MSEHAHMIDLRGMNAVVTGGSRGIGRATALLLGRAGASVGIGYRSRSEEAEATVSDLEAVGVAAWSVQGDLSEPAVVEALFSRADDEFEGLDIFVGSHGMWPPLDTRIADMTDEQWHETMGANLHSVFYTCRAAAQRLRDHGRLVLVGSTAGQRGEAYHADYASTKGAMIALVKGLCVELAPRGITVNCVAPGWVDTEMSATAYAGEGRERIARAIPLGRVASADDVAGPILFLCTPLARHITGEVVNVNGGSVLAG